MQRQIEMKIIIHVLVICFFLPLFGHAQEINMKDKNNAKVAYNKGIESIKEKDYFVALEYLTAALNFNPGFASGHLMVK